MKNPITDKSRPSLACLGAHYILLMALKTKLVNEGEPNWKAKEKVQITYADIQTAMESKFPPDQAFKKQLQYLASYGYIRQENRDGIIFITLL